MSRTGVSNRVFCSPDWIPLTLGRFSVASKAKRRIIPPDLDQYTLLFASDKRSNVAELSVESVQPKAAMSAVLPRPCLSGVDESQTISSGSHDTLSVIVVDDSDDSQATIEDYLMDSEWDGSSDGHDDGSDDDFLVKNPERMIQ